MGDRVLVRLMAPDDVDGAYRSDSIALAETAEEKEQVSRRSSEEVERRKARYRHLLATDPGGCWVAVDGERAVGSALALRRESLWGLSLFAVDAAYRGAGIGRRLLERALSYAEDCRGAIIASSAHPAAMRRYALAGFELLPTLMASGSVKRETLPAVPTVRDGTDTDLELVAEVDRRVRGASHGPDLEFLLGIGGHLLICERPDGRGYAFEREGSSPLLAATHPAVAAELLWACLAEAQGTEEVEVRWLTAAQSRWAMPVVLGAGLTLSPAGPLCVRGELGPLAPYLPSGPFL